MSSQDLTTLAALKSWLGVPGSVTSDDATLTALVTAASRAICALISRPGLLPQSYAETIDLERSRVYLRHWPVLKVNERDARRHSALARDARASAPMNGYCLKPGDAAPPGAPQALDLFDQRIRPRRQNLVVNYFAGYAVESEARPRRPPRRGRSAPPNLSALGRATSASSTRRPARR